jgi:hypothetical protein
MKLFRRKFLHLAAGAAALPALSRIARAQTYPRRPVRMIVPLAPGSAVDSFARLIAQKLSENVGKQFYVENVGGAGGNNVNGCQDPRIDGGRGSAMAALHIMQVAQWGPEVFSFLHEDRFSPFTVVKSPDMGMREIYMPAIDESRGLTPGLYFDR